jgi:hypothetical protein
MMWNNVLILVDAHLLERMVSSIGSKEAKTFRAAAHELAIHRSSWLPDNCNLQPVQGMMEYSTPISLYATYACCLSSLSILVMDHKSSHIHSSYDLVTGQLADVPTQPKVALDLPKPSHT